MSTLNDIEVKKRKSNVKKEYEKYTAQDVLNLFGRYHIEIYKRNLVGNSFIGKDSRVIKELINEYDIWYVLNAITTYVKNESDGYIIRFAERIDQYDSCNPKIEFLVRMHGDGAIKMIWAEYQSYHSTILSAMSQERIDTIRKMKDYLEHWSEKYIYG